MSMRMEKINQELRRQITDIIQHEVDDPKLDFLSITKVQTSPDLRESKIYFSLLDESQLAHAQKVLQQMRGFIKTRLRSRIRLKTLPQLHFFADDTIKYSVDIHKKIEEIQKQSPDKDNSE